MRRGTEEKANGAKKGADEAKLLGLKKGELEGVKKSPSPVIPIPQSRERNLQLFVFYAINADASPATAGSA